MGRLYFIFFFVAIILSSAFHPDNVSAEGYLEKGITEYKAENYEESLVSLKKARQEQPESSVAAFYLGLAYKQIGNLQSSVSEFKDALTLKPFVQDAYPELIEVLYKLDQLKEAKEWIAKAESAGIKPAHIAFLKGLVLIKEGDADRAIESFRRAKELDHSMAQAADFQIAMAQARQKKVSEARQSLKAVLQIDPSSELAQFAKEYDDALSRFQRAHKDWNLTVGVQYQYDDNVVLQPSSAIPGVVITGAKDSGIIGTFKVDYTPLPSGDWFLTGQYYFYSDTYFRTTSHSMISQSVSLTPGLNMTKGAISLPLSFQYSWLKGDPYMTVFNVRPTLNLLVYEGYIGQFSVGYARRNMLQAQSIEDPNEDRDADIFTESFAVIKPFANGRGIVSLRCEISDEDTKGKNWDNIGTRGDLSAFIPVTAKTSLMLNGDVFLQRYRNTNTIFGITRKDSTYSGSAGVVHEITKALKMNVQYSHTRADSNIAIYDYSRNVYTAGLEFSF